jgi:predicted RNA-binding Zn-ribbon protein involved in translation (DUF1610 family)
MPTLDESQLKSLNERESFQCPECGRMVRMNYCRSCDLYFTDGHSLDCPSMRAAGYANNDHSKCRTY